MDLFTFVVLLLSVLGNVVFVVVGVCLWKFIVPPSAMLIIRKRMGQLKDSMLALVCYDDGAAVLKALKIKHEGCLEQDYGDGTSETYYIAKPTADTGDAAVDRDSYELDKVMLPSLSLDGFPVALCYALDGVVTNANTLLGLQTANLVNSNAPRSVGGVIKVPSSVSGGGRGRVREVLTTIKIKVLLPINALDVHRKFNKYWDQSMLHATKQRHQNIGAAKSKKDSEKLGRLILILCSVVGIAILACGIVAGWLLR